MNDKDIYDLAKILEEDCIDFDICQLEIHHINPDFVSTGKTFLENLDSKEPSFGTLLAYLVTTA